MGEQALGRAAWADCSAQCGAGAARVNQERQLAGRPSAHLPPTACRARARQQDLAAGLRVPNAQCESASGGLGAPASTQALCSSAALHPMSFTHSSCTRGFQGWSDNAVSVLQAA